MTSRALRLAPPAGRERLEHGWQACATAPGQCTSPEHLESLPAQRWLAIDAPMPAAAALRAAGLWSLDGAVRRFDAEDWWYRVRFDAPAGDDGEPVLGFDGLAGVAEAWLNGEPLLRSDNMFVAHEQPVGRLLRREGNTLVLRFPSLDAMLAQRRPRPRWRAPMVEHQQLRWFRTSLLGRTPGWSLPAAPVGPWKDVWVERRHGPVVHALRLQPAVHDDGRGVVVASCAVQGSVDGVELVLRRDGEMHHAPLSRTGAGEFAGALEVAQVARWWPHTHGEPALYDARLVVRAPGGAVELPCGPVGFRTVELDTTGGRLSLRVNGVPVFCRGACWMPLDPVRLRAPREACVQAVAQARDAGMNMLRVCGPTVYEDDAFFDACDAQGMLVWQDFMFANMDYPHDDAAFAESVRTEAAQQLARWQGRASLAVLCGNSEVEQQAAMWGAPRELWSPPLFHATLREMARQALPGVPYWPSSAHGGAFPHQGDAGSTSYYGVGAYLRPFDDARRAGLSFATECLAFANMPEDHTIARMPGGLSLRVHHPTWHTRAPRDHGTGWDFEDVRDHYVRELFGVDPQRCRQIEHDRYVALSRVASGEAMARAFVEWRRPGSGCGGALVWYLRDLWAGAGWGVLDDAGLPKPCWHFLRRTLQPVAVFITDEGGNGLHAHVVNERARPLDAVLELTVLGGAQTRVAHAQRALHVPAHGALSLPLAQLLDEFMDLSYAYRFGPPPASVVHVGLHAGEGGLAGETFFFPVTLPAKVEPDVGLAATFHRDAGALALDIGTQRLAFGVHVEVEGHEPSDNHFHLLPGARRRIILRPTGERAGPLRGHVGALNAERVLDLRLE